MQLDEANLSTVITELGNRAQTNPSSPLPCILQETLLPVQALVLAVPLMLLIIVVSLGGNVMVVMSFRRGSMQVDAQSLYLLNLAVSDLLISAVCMPLHAVSMIFSSRWLLGPVLCKLYTAVQLTLLNVTTLALVLVAVDGLVQANMDVRSTVAEAKRRARLLLAACWILAVVVHVPETVVSDWVRGYSVLRPFECRPEFYLSVARVVFLQVWDFFLPVIVLSVVNTKLYFRLKSLSLTILAYSTNLKTQQLCEVQLGPEADVQRHSHNFGFRQVFSETNRTSSASPTGDFNASSAVTFECRAGTSADVGEGQANAAQPVNASQPTTSIPKVRLHKVILSKAGKLRQEKRQRRRRNKWSKSHTGEAYISGGEEPITPATTSGTASSTFVSLATMEAGSGGGDDHRHPRQLQLDTPRRLKRVAMIMFTLVLILVVCWLPYSVAFLLTSVCQDCVHPILYGGLVWLLYCKSCINPFLYAYNTFAFRNKFRRLLARVVPVKRLRRIPTDRVSNERASILN
ncbi:tyramine receptor Ser-2-like [Littorina saxatilis]